MNKIEYLEDGTFLMTIKVNGKETKRECFVDNRITHSIDKIRPKLQSGELLYEMVSGEMEILQG